MIYINDKEVNLIYNLGQKVKEVFSYGTKIWPKEVLFDYMYFKLADGYTSGNVSYKFDEYYNLHNKYLKISTDGSNWQDWTEAISMSPNVKYYVKGEDSYVRNSNISDGFFTSDVSQNAFNIECGGDVMSLCNLATEITTNYCFIRLFYNMTNLLTPPKLPATTLASYCYSNMFQNCTSLTKTQSVLPATTLARYCYNSMFLGCTSLTQAPELPATTLVNYCYHGMFYNCSSLTQAPELPATTLARNCYDSMFSNSSKLNWIKALFTTTPSTSYTKNWVNGVSAQGVFVKSIDATWTTTGVNAVPTGWTVIYYDKTEGKYYTTKTKEVECDQYGNVKQKIDAMYFKLADGETSGNVSYQFDEYHNLHNKYLKISTDGNNWTDWTEAISMVPNTKYYVKGEDGYVRNTNVDISGAFFTSDVSQNNFNIECGGNVMSLCNMATEITTQYCFLMLFENMTNLLTPPELPATTLADSCYVRMFSGCSSLIKAPALPATTLAVGCYFLMFQGCSSLTQTHTLQATTLANYCYSGMFYGCTSLIKAPELPATTLADSCYVRMFLGCSSLIKAPELPATTLTYDCYARMFNGCSSLIKAPVLTATTLTTNCYANMFNGCTSLTEITLNGDFNSSYATDWVRNVSPSGTFYNNSDLDIQVGVNGIPAGWTEIRPVTSHYMYFKLQDGSESGNVSYKFDEYYNLHNKYLKISTDCNNWSDWTGAISMAPNTKYFVKGEDNFVRNSDISDGFFSSDVSQNQFNIKCGGNVMSLCNLATEINTNYCFIRLFYDMRNLLTPPKLPATTLANYCYSGMFSGCNSLTQAPALPATTLKNNCYSGMFLGCTSLIEAPELPAERLTSSCYTNMFNNANKLNWIKALFTDKPITSPFNSPTKNWVKGVSSHGVFVKNINATWTTTGVNAVPTGWTVIYYDQREGKYFKTKTKEVECDKYGNPF